MAETSRFGDTLKLSLPLAFAAMMAAALLVMMYASVELVGKVLVDSERSRVSQVALSIALELEKSQTDIDRLTDSLAILSQTIDDKTELKQRLGARLEQESQKGMVIGGGIWPEPYTLDSQQQRASLFWGLTDDGLNFYDSYNSPDEPPYFEALWYLASKHIADGCFWSGAYSDPFTLEPMMTCARAVYRGERFTGVASVDASLSGIEQALDGNMANVYGYAFVLDRNLRVLARPNDEALQRQLGIDYNIANDAFPAQLDLITEKPAFQPVADFITDYRKETLKAPLSNELLHAFKDTVSYYAIEDVEPITAYIQRGNVSERKRVQGWLDMEPVLGEPAEMFLVHMPRVDSFLLIVVPQRHFLSQSRSTLFSLLAIMLAAVTLGGVVLWVWLRRALIKPLDTMVTQIESGQERPLDTNQKYELKALATAYNANQKKLRGSRESLQNAHERYRDILRSSNEPIAVIDEQGVVAEANTALLTLLGLEWGEVQGSRFASYLLDEDRDAMSGWLSEIFSEKGVANRLEISIPRSGDKCFVEISASVSKNDNGKILTLFMRDVSERRAAEREIAKMAVTDSLTGLYNRAGFTKLLEESLLEAKAGGLKVALLFIDLDYFKEVNDVRGHEAGDQLLIMVAQRLLGRRRATDVVARLGGDEFALVLKWDGDMDVIARICQEVVDSLNRPFYFEHSEAARIGASVGVSVYPDHADRVSELVRKADVAMYQAKCDGRNDWRLYAKEQADAHQRRQRLIQDLKKAVVRNQLLLEYQPIVNRCGEVVFLEALVRWQHPLRGRVSPMDFIPLAEKTGLIVEIGRWVIDTVCETIARWRDAGLEVPAISVNISVVQLQRDKLTAVFDRALGEFGIKPSQILLEVTESLLLESTDSTELQELRKRGFGVAVDDFGTGYSSLSYLQTHPVDYLKIDKAFVAALIDRPDYSLCRSIIKLSKGLNTQVIAEGVEEDFQFWQLADMQSDYMQGYWISKPLPQTDVPAWLESFSLPARDEPL